jgi:ribonuclease P protein component
MVFALAWLPQPAARFLPVGALKAALASHPNGCAFGAALLPSPAGFSPQQRLHTAAEFGRVFAEPARSSDRFFTVLARPSDRNVARLGLTISRRAAKRAVDRNKLKRLARESFRLQRDLPSWDFVVLAKPGAHVAASAALRESLDRHFDRMKQAATAGRHG